MTWRQHRIQLAATAAIVGAVCALMLLMGQTAHTSFNSSGLAACLATGGECDRLRSAFGNRFNNLQFLLVLMLICPLLVGLFWGPSLVAREVEQGTHRLAWTQGVTRRRWMITKFATTGGAVALLSLGYAATATWFTAPFNSAFDVRLTLGIFDLQGILPVVYTLFAFTIGAAAGAIFRRVMPAMAATLVGFAVIRGVIVAFVRTTFQPTRVVSFATLGSNRQSRGWVVHAQIVDKAGRIFSHNGDFSIGPDTVHQWCPNVVLPADRFGPPPAALDQCIRGLGLRTIETIHPTSQFWAFQFIEAGLFLAASLALAGFTVWWVLRKVA